MSVLSPLGFLLFSLALPLVLLYFLKTRRRELRVSSLLLWEPARRDREASTLSRRLQRDSLLLLQLLALAALTLALARPVLTLAAHGAQRVVIVLDSSASMKATDVAPSRFAAAQREALALVGRLGEGAEVMVVEAGIQPRVVVPFTRGRDRIRSAITGLAARDFPNHLGEAIRTARALTAQEARAEIHVFTDGALSASLVAREVDDPTVHWVGVGRRGRNVGITQFAIRKTSYRAFDYQAFLSVVNYSAEPASFTLSLAADERPLVEKFLTLDPNVRRSVVLPFRHQGGGVVRADVDLADDLAADNVAYAVIPPPRPIRVLLVSRGNLFLEKALRVDPQVALEVRPPEAYPGGMGGFDVVVVDSVSPPKLGPGRYILVNAVPSDVPLEVLGRMEQPVIMDWDRSHPIMQQVDVSKVVIEEALRVRPVAAGRPLIEAIGGPLLYVLEEPQRNAIFVGFDLFRTDFPLRVAFPLILANSLRWLSPAGLDPSSLQIAAGEPIRIPVEHGVTSAMVKTPSGRTVEAPVTRGRVSFAETDEVGIYTIAAPKGETHVAVNLMNAQESDLTPRPLPVPKGDGGPLTPSVPVQRELWPLFVVLAVLLLATEGALYWRRQSGGRLRPPIRVGDRWALGLRGVLVALLLLALVRPAIPRWVDRLNVAFLLDVSDSVSLAARDKAYRVAAQALSAMHAQDQASLIVFGEEAVVDQPLGPKRTLERPHSQVPGRKTDIAQAIRLGLATLPSGQANRLILLSDGRQNSGDARAAAQIAKQMGADLYYVPLPLTFPQEVVVESLLLPEEVKFGEPFDAKVVAWSQEETQGRLSLFRNGEFLGSQVVRLSAGKNVFSYRQALEQSGIHAYQAAIEAEADPIEENKRAVGTVVVRGRPQVLLAEKERAHAQALTAALRAQHIDVEVVDPERIPKDLAGFQKYDGLILSNVSSLKLTKKQMEHIRDYVRDYGGGLIMVGGEESFGLGGYYRTPIEEALPVTMEVKQRLEIPSLAVVLIIDRSGSMAMSTEDQGTKLDLAKEASHLVVDLLDERSEVGVMSFDTEFVWDVPLQTARGKTAIHRAIATIKAGGGTDGYPAVKEAYRVLFESRALLKHVIFLSDGEMALEQFPGLIPRMVKDKITVSAVAIGKDAEVKFMVNIAKWGHGRFYYTDDSQSIPRIFTLETQLASKASLVEQPFKPAVSNPGHQILQDIDWKSAPPLGGYVATSLKSSAEQLLMTSREDPLLATWRYGLGRAAAFTSDAKGKWGALWVRWPEFNKFWGQLTRWTLRTGSRSDAVATVERRGGIGEVTVEAIDPKGEFINFLDAEVGVVAPDRQRSVVELEQVAPGRYRGRFPAAQEGVYLVGLMERRGDHMVGSQLAGLAIPYPDEYRYLGADETLLQELAELTGGDAVRKPKDVFAHARRRSRLSMELWPWLVGVVAVMLLPEIALRRIGAGSLRRLVSRFSSRKPGGKDTT